MNRRNLSGIFIFHKFDDDPKRKPTCFEDCPEEKQKEWMDTLPIDGVKSLALMLAKTLRKVADKFDICSNE
jgi:hypothetical protein